MFEMVAAQGFQYIIIGSGIGFSGNDYPGIFKALDITLNIIVEISNG